jgi:LEA14-like dessication related protein
MTYEQLRAIFRRARYLYNPEEFPLEVGDEEENLYEEMERRVAEARSETERRVAEARSEERIKMERRLAEERIEMERHIAAEIERRMAVETTRRVAAGRSEAG